MEIVEKRRLKRAEIIEEARRWASVIPFQATVVLVGSYARGDFNLWSDVDIVLLSDEFSGTPIKRLERVDAPPGFQVIPLTTRDLYRLLRRRDVLGLEIIRHGVILRDDLGIVNKYGDVEPRKSA